MSVELVKIQSDEEVYKEIKDLVEKIQSYKKLYPTATNTIAKNAGLELGRVFFHSSKKIKEEDLIPLVFAKIQVDRIKSNIDAQYK